MCINSQLEEGIREAKRKVGQRTDEELTERQETKDGAKDAYTSERRRLSAQNGIQAPKSAE